MGVTLGVMVGVTRGVTIAVTFGVMRAVTDVVVTVVVLTAVVLTLAVVLPTAVVPTVAVVLPTAVLAILVLAIVPRPVMFPVVVATAAPRPAIVAVLPTTFGLMRAVMFGVREPTLRFGVRMMPCALTSDAPSNINATAAAIGAAAAPGLAIRRLTSRWFNKEPPYRSKITARGPPE